MSHEVLVRTVASGVCHSDLHFVDGLYPMQGPAILGHEAAGIVEEVGDQVDYVKPGDHVIACLSLFCGRCEMCMTGKPFLCTSVSACGGKSDPPKLTWRGTPVGQFANLGSYAEKMLLYEGAVVKIPNDMPFGAAALIGCGVTTGVGAVLNTARVSRARQSRCSAPAAWALGHPGRSHRRRADDHRRGRVRKQAGDGARELGATHIVDASSRDAVEASGR